MAELIYGVDPNKKVTEIMVRDAIVKCFMIAHCHMLDPLKKKYKPKTEEEFEEIKEREVIRMIKRMMALHRGNFDNPTKKDLENLVNNLRQYASNFRDIKTINKNTKLIMTLINKIE